MATSGGDHLSTLLDLPHHAVVDRGRIVGLWDYDADAGAIVARTWVEGTADAIARTERFVRDDLGDARAFSLDAPHSTGRSARGERLAALRAAG